MDGMKVHDSRTLNRLLSHKVEKRWIHEHLVRINRGLELLEAVPYEEQEEYLRRYLQIFALS